jgi:hypothetical protein
MDEFVEKVVSITSQELELMAMMIFCSLDL